MAVSPGFRAEPELHGQYLSGIYDIYGIYEDFHLCLPLVFKQVGNTHGLTLISEVF